MERLEKVKILRATAFRLEQMLTDLRDRLGDLKGEAKPLGAHGAEFAKEIHDVIGQLDEAAGRIAAAGRKLEGREIYADDEQPTAASLVIADDIELERPEARALAVMLASLEYAYDHGDWQGRLASEAAAWLIRQHPDLMQELRTLAEEAGPSASLAFHAQMKP